MTANHSSYLQIAEIADGKVHCGMASGINNRREMEGILRAEFENQQFQGQRTVCAI